MNNDTRVDKRSQRIEQLRGDHLMPLVNNILIFSGDITGLHLQRPRPLNLPTRARKKQA